MSITLFGLVFRLCYERGAFLAHEVDSWETEGVDREGKGFALQLLFSQDVSQRRRLVKILAVFETAMIMQGVWNPRWKTHMHITDCIQDDAGDYWGRVVYSWWFPFDPRQVTLEEQRVIVRHDQGTADKETTFVH